MEWEGARAEAVTEGLSASAVRALDRIRIAANGGVTARLAPATANADQVARRLMIAAHSSSGGLARHPGSIEEAISIMEQIEIAAAARGPSVFQSANAATQRFVAVTRLADGRLWAFVHRTGATSAQLVRDGRVSSEYGSVYAITEGRVRMTSSQIQQWVNRVAASTGP